MILGVCKGLAQYFDGSVFWFRFIAVIGLLCTGLWPLVIFYLAAALWMKPEPVIPVTTEDEEEIYDSYLRSRQRVAQRLIRRYDDLEKRIRRMEHIVTDREFDWEQRLRE